MWRRCPEDGERRQRFYFKISGAKLARLTQKLLFGRDWKNLLWRDKPVRAVALWRLENEFKGF